jgi:lantibiotic biosynthesis protein
MRTPAPLTSQPRHRPSAREGAGPIYRPLSALVVRAPLLPASDYHDLGRGDDGAARGWADPAFRFAVSVASPDLARALSVPGGPGRSPARARTALQRYLIRACLRPTPFGGFAAVAIGRWADRTSLQIAAADWPTRTRPDMAWLTAVAQRLAGDPDRLSSLRVFANTCALDREGRIYLADPSTGGSQDAPDVSVRASSLVRAVLARARNGTGLSELRQYVLEYSPRATQTKADLLLAELCQHQLLVPELLPSLTGDPLAHLVGQLPADDDCAGRLSAIGAQCAQLDADRPGAAAARLPSVREQMNSLAACLGIEPSDEDAAALQVDSALPLLGSGITRQIADDVASAVDVLLRLHPSPSAGTLASYRAAFHRRYGDERRVPLLELLDPRFGLGPPGGSDPARYPAGPPASGLAGSHRAGLLQSLLAGSIRDACSEVILDGDLIEGLSTWVPDPQRLAPSVELSVFVAARSRSAIDRGDYRLVVGPNLGAGAAGRGLGRFADLLGAPARELLQEAADAEADVSGLIAELVYRPVRARAANVAIRPLVRSFELPVGVAPSLPADAVIRMDELSVMLHDGRLRVWWERAGCEVSLAAGHMLNAAASPPLCRQLVELASDGVTSLAPFDWGPLSMMPFLPRVRTGRVVLSPAQWRLSLAAGSDLSGPGGQARFETLLEEWRARWRLPRHAYLTRADNRLLLDLENAGHREQLRVALARSRQRTAILQEGLPGPEDAWLPGPRGRHVVELVVPLVRGRRHSRPAGHSGHHHPGPDPDRGHAARITPRWPDTDRLRPPGSDWLYVILNGPRATEDALLAGPLGALADRFVEQGDADGWFFVRYGDPGPQLRLRVHGAAATLIDRVLPALARWGAEAIAEGSRTQLAVVTYDRELERYGGPAATELCERMACADARAVRLLLAAADTANPPVLRDRLELALVSTADLLASLTRDPVSLAPRGQDAAAITARSGALYRERQPHLRSLLAALQENPAPSQAAPSQAAPSQAAPSQAAPPLAAQWQTAQWQAVRHALADRRTRLVPLVAELRDQRRDGAGSRTVEQLIPSLVHMHANRLGLNRTDEQLMLGLLDRTLRSIRAYP